MTKLSNKLNDKKADSGHDFGEKMKRWSWTRLDICIRGSRSPHKSMIRVNGKETEEKVKEAEEERA